MALEHEELAEVITSWSLLSADLRQAIPSSTADLPHPEVTPVGARVGSEVSSDFSFS